MFDAGKMQRPPLTERYGKFLELQDLNNFIELLRAAYIETSNEKVLRVLGALENLKENLKKEHLTWEEIFRQDEIREFWSNPGAFPEAVRTWFFDYRDKEIQ